MTSHLNQKIKSKTKPIATLDKGLTYGIMTPLLKAYRQKGDYNVKETYHTPKLVIHGTVEQMTQIFGSTNAGDYVIWGSHAFGPTPFGSEDCVIPCWPKP